jgi:hypothetical protein
LTQTKFEDFIARLEDATSASTVNAFLQALFECSEHEFNFNHAAIWYLIQTRHATTCITTNFDNAIERASGNTLSRYIGDGLPEFSPAEPTLMKPHGDVISGEYVATNALLFSGSRQRKFDRLSELLRNKTVLVIGYSGTGDVDIAPSLRKAAEENGTRFVWTVEPGKDPATAPAYAAVAQFDLFQNSSADNWLLGLAVRYGAGSFRQRVGPSWRKRLRHWFDGLAVGQIRDFVAMFFAGRVGWPLNHLLQVREWSFGSVAVSDLTRGRALIEIPDYRSAMTRFENAAALGSDLVKINTWKGFCLWRMGREDGALELLGPIALAPSPTEASRTQTAACRRHYLEVVRDRLRRVSSSGIRRQLADKYEIDAVRTLFLREAASVNYDEALLTEIVLTDLDRLMGRPRLECLVEVRETYRMARDLLSRNAAGSAARALTLLSVKEGFRALRDTGVFGRDYYNLQEVRKGLVFLMAAVLPVSWEWLVLDLFDGRHAARAHLAWMGWWTRWRLRKWREAYFNDEVILERSRNWQLL